MLTVKMIELGIGLSKIEPLKSKAEFLILKSKFNSQFQAALGAPHRIRKFVF